MAGGFGILVSKDAHTILPPLEFAYAASVVEKRGHEARIVDAPALEVGAQRVLKVASREKPDLIVTNTTSISLDNDLKICNDLKERLPGTLVCLTGAFASVMPEIAASVTGMLVFTATPSSGYLHTFTGNDLDLAPCARVHVTNPVVNVMIHHG
jgi:hypothetical protein